MSEYIIIGLIPVSLIAVALYFLTGQKPHQKQTERYGKHIFVSNGVNLKTMRYGKEPGERFPPTGELDGGTVIVEGNALPACTITLSNMQTGAQYTKSFRTEVYLGREQIGDRHDNKIVIEGDNSISRTHCRIRYLNHQLLLDDLNTKNHTYLNGMQVRGTSVINQNDELQIGGTKLSVRFKGAR